MADRREFLGQRQPLKPPRKNTGKDALNRSISGFDWPLNTPAAPPPQRLSYKQRLVRMRQGVVGGRFLHTISSGKRLWKTRTIDRRAGLAIAPRNAIDLSLACVEQGRLDSLHAEGLSDHIFRQFCPGLPIIRHSSSNAASASARRKASTAATLRNGALDADHDCGVIGLGIRQP